MKYMVTIGWGCKFIFDNGADALTFIKLAAYNRHPENEREITMEVINSIPDKEAEEVEDEGQE